MTDPVLPLSLRVGLQNRSIILFAGAGLSKISEAPIWSELLRGLVEHAEEEGIELLATKVQALEAGRGSTEEKYALAEHLRQRMRNHFGDYVRRQLEHLEPSEAHRKLVRVNWSGFITTNYDTLLEDAYYDVHGERLRVITWNDVDELSRLDELDRWILKIHGCVTRTNTIVLDDTSLNTLLQAGTTSEVLRGLFRRYSILFAGYGLSDPDVLPELRRLATVFGQSTRRHYAFLSDSNSALFWRQYLEDRYSVQPLIYDTQVSHLAGLMPWLSQLEAKGIIVGRANRKKILCVVKALRYSGGMAPRESILVTDEIPRWGVQRPEIKSGISNRLEKAFMLPPLDDLGQDRIAAAASFAEQAGLPPESVSIVEIGDTFENTKYNPALDRDTDYSFRLATIKIAGHEDWFENDHVRFRDVTCAWKSIDELRQHNPTKRLNGDVLDAILDAYGEDLQGAPYSMSRSLISARDPYAERAARYGELAWVKDRVVLDEILQNEVLNGTSGILDLGCGTGFAGEYLRHSSGLPYVGVDRSFNMFREAKEILGGADNVRLLHEDFVVREASRDKFDGYVFLLKNVLHLIDDVYELWPRLFRDWGQPAKIVVIETVSPDPECRFWVDHVFKRMGAAHKRHLFTADDLNSPIATAGLRITHSERIEQFIDVHDWLDSFDLSNGTRSNVLRTIEDASERVVENMKISLDDGGRLRMLRLQQLLVAERV